MRIFQQLLAGQLFSRSLERNITYLYFESFFRSLIFIIPIWVAYEMQYLTFAQFTMIEAIILGTQMVLELPTGAFADLFGRRASVLLSVVFAVISMILYANARTFPAFVIMGLFSGLAEALRSGAAEALLYDTLKETGREDQFDKIIAKASLIFQIGIALATFVGGVVAKWGFLAPIYLQAVAFSIAFFWVFLMVEPHIDSEKFTLRNYLLQTKHGVEELLKNTHIKLVSLFYMLVGGITWVSALVFTTTFSTTIGFTAFEMGIVFPLLRVFNGFVLFKGLHVEKIFTRRNVYLLFPSLLMITYLPGMWLSKWISIPFLAGAMITSTARWVILAKYTNMEFAPKNRATAISALNMGVSLLYVLILFISNQITSGFSGMRVVWTMLGVLSTLFVLPIGIMLAKNKHFSK